METLARAISSDIPLGAFDDAANTKTSVFFDVMGMNWDASATEKANRASSVYKETEIGRTAVYIDYACDAYRSTLHNTATWCLFILTSELTSRWQTPILFNLAILLPFNAAFCFSFGIFDIYIRTTAK